LLEAAAPITARQLFGLAAGGPAFERGTAPTPPAPVNDAAGGVRIETERLVLRSYRTDDYAALHRMMSDGRMFAYSHRGPMRCEESWSQLLRQVGHWSALGYGVFAIEERATGELVGETGFCDFRRGLGPQFDSCPEATWSVVPEAQRRGLAGEAAAAAASWLDRQQRFERSVCLVHERNLASLKVAAALGYRPFAAITYRGYPARLLERDAA
jgi:RimJ/RimL family protein N-acetyltransferase